MNDSFIKKFRYNEDTINTQINELSWHKIAVNTTENSIYFFARSSIHVLHISTREWTTTTNSSIKLLYSPIYPYSIHNKFHCFHKGGYYTYNPYDTDPKFIKINKYDQCGYDSHIVVQKQWNISILNRQELLLIGGCYSNGYDMKH